jgi:hypothetical protein
MAKFTLIKMTLAAFTRGANLPYFGNQSDLIPPFPHEPKRTVLRAYQELAWIPFRETEPELGVFLQWSYHLPFGSSFPMIK